MKHILRNTLPKEDHLDDRISPYQLRLFNPEEHSIYTTHFPNENIYSGLTDHEIGKLHMLDLDDKHRDEDLHEEFDRRMSGAFLRLFAVPLIDPSSGVTIRLSAGLEQELRRSAGIGL